MPCPSCQPTTTTVVQPITTTYTSYVVTTLTQPFFAPPLLNTNILPPSALPQQPAFIPVQLVSYATATMPGKTFVQSYVEIITIAGPTMIQPVVQTTSTFYLPAPTQPPETRTVNGKPTTETLITTDTRTRTVNRELVKTMAAWTLTEFSIITAIAIPSQHPDCLTDWETCCDRAHRSTLPGVETRVLRRDLGENCEQWSSTAIYFTLPGDKTVTQFVTETAYQPQRAQQIWDDQVQATPQPAPVGQIPDGQVQAVPPQAPAEQIPDGQVQAPKEAAASSAPKDQIPGDQIQAPELLPVQQIGDGQVQMPAGAPTQQSTGIQVQSPTEESPIQPVHGSPVQQIPDGQIQMPAAPPSPQAPSARESSSPETSAAKSEGAGAGSQEKEQGQVQKGIEAKEEVQAQGPQSAAGAAAPSSNPTTPAPITSTMTTTISNPEASGEQRSSLNSSTQPRESASPSSSCK